MTLKLLSSFRRRTKLDSPSSDIDIRLDIGRAQDDFQQAKTNIEHQIDVIERLTKIDRDKRTEQDSKDSNTAIGSGNASITIMKAAVKSLESLTGQLERTDSEEASKIRSQYFIVDGDGWDINGRINRLEERFNRSVSEYTAAHAPSSTQTGVPSPEA